RRVLDPILNAALDKGTDQDKMQTLRALAEIDPLQALEFLQQTRFDDPGSTDPVRLAAAENVFKDDPVEAESIVESFKTPIARAHGLMTLAAALPDSERARKRTLLERATLQMRAPADAKTELQPQGRIPYWGRLAEAWLDLGESDKARDLFREGILLVEALPPARWGVAVEFFGRLARLEPEKALSLIQRVNNPVLRQGGYELGAIGLALE